MGFGAELIAGIVLLYLGAEWLVKGAAGLGRAFGVRPVVVGLTAVAYGTSMPELVVSLAAAMDGKSGLALGNVIGSNLANLGLILAVTVILAPVIIESSLSRRETPVMLGAALLLPLILTDGVISRLEGLLLLSGAAAFTYLTARSGLPSSKEMAEVEADAEAVGAPPGKGKLRLGLIALFGLALLVIGGEAFVAGASGLALTFGISERIVGLTIVSVGTSAPELAASIVAALRGHPSLAIGNVVGSNIFNVLFVLGGVAAIQPVPGTLEAFGFDVAAMAALSLLTLLLFRYGGSLSRREGLLLLGCYVAYLATLILS